MVTSLPFPNPVPGGPHTGVWWHLFTHQVFLHPQRWLALVVFVSLSLASPPWKFHPMGEGFEPVDYAAHLWHLFSLFFALFVCPSPVSIYLDHLSAFRDVFHPYCSFQMVRDTVLPFSIMAKPVTSGCLSPGWQKVTPYYIRPFGPAVLRHMDVVYVLYHHDDVGRPYDARDMQLKRTARRENGASSLPQLDS